MPKPEFLFRLRNRVPVPLVIALALNLLSVTEVRALESEVPLLLRHIDRGRHVEIPLVTAALALLLGINMIELLPNATITPLTWLIAGALLGYAAREDIRVTDTAAPEPPPAARTVL